ncbi:MAG: glycosyl transferase family 1 [Alphaproteobacteria bacterium]|jgi:ATP-binding cassette subfamily F protein 3|nr:glycosyl transferase family 1 [Alphaproteobacteria bacterium]PPR13542.1 MAG: putative ABC transporter ATP-binding protein YheS [Alphaproteobacteria bacterium MarineAlpha12_Bin1]|tara:strand:+ start:9900 stop:11789 length:1890 start_codon:yes stop_codon:yes gene_type:complete
MLKINNLTYRIGERVLLNKANATVSAGSKTAVLGRNGAGKTTLFKLIMGELISDEGSIDHPPSWKISMTSQEAPNGKENLINTVMSADRKLLSLLKESETAENPERIAEIHETLADKEAYKAPSNAAKILAGLGFSNEDQSQSCDAFSGGWRMRVALASLLFLKPDLLLLDEPTNYLDLEAVIWFEDYISSYPGTVLLISHDRDLLNSSVDKVIHLDQTKLTSYRGNYDRFVETHRLKIELSEKQRVKEESERKHIEQFITRFRSKATKAKQAQSRIKMLARMKPITNITEERAANFSFPKIEKLAPPLFNLEKIDVGYNNQAIIKNLSGRIDSDDRIALLGANGNGKSTFIKLLAGVLKPISGSIQMSSKLKIGYFSQDLAESLDLTATPYSQIQKISPKTKPEKIRNHLGAFGFSKEMALEKINHLSGGEKARLLFAQISIQSPHILLLDEPTNHLDILSRHALVHAINEFDGAVIIVSHDPYLLEATVDNFWLIADQKLQIFEGDMDDYRTFMLNQSISNDNSDTEQSSTIRNPLNKKEIRRKAAEKRASLTTLRGAAKKAESELSMLIKKKENIIEFLKEADSYKKFPDKALQLQKEMGKLQKQLETVEEQWIDTQMKLENESDS